MQSIDANQCININSKLIRIGTNYGCWVIPKDFIDHSSICYCFGVGEDASFDLGLITHCGATVFSFDPTPCAIKHIDYITKTILKSEVAYCNNNTNSVYKVDFA